jgi:GDP-L-fucose synthase
MRYDDKIFVAGHKGLVGSAIVNKLKLRGYQNILTRDRHDLDLTNQVAVSAFLEQERPSVIVIAAAKVGGILANNKLRSDFLYENLMIQNNLIMGGHRIDAEKVVFLGSSCIYPRLCRQPMHESDLLTGPLEYTNRPYALAKIAGLELINALNIQYGRRYFSVMPTNLFGPRDNFHPEHSHVLPALIRRFHEAKEATAKDVVIWGTGSPLREFLYSEDCADAIVHLMENLDESFYSSVNDSEQKFFHINIGSGLEVSIKELAEEIKLVVGYKGTLTFDSSKPDGTPRKLLDVSQLYSTGWRPTTSLRAGIESSYKWYLDAMKV